MRELLMVIFTGLALISVIPFADGSFSEYPKIAVMAIFWIICTYATAVWPKRRRQHANREREVSTRAAFSQVVSTPKSIPARIIVGDCSDICGSSVVIFGARRDNSSDNYFRDMVASGRVEHPVTHISVREKNRPYNEDQPHT